MDILTSLANHYGTDKGTVEKSGAGEGERYQPHGFTPFYDRILQHLRMKPISLLEVGVLDGMSMMMWKDYFPLGLIHGIDISFDRTTTRFDRRKFNRADTARLMFKIVNQESRNQLDRFGVQYGPFDVIIDDGGHTMLQQQTTLGCMFRFLTPGGIYILEDIHTSNFPGEWGVDADKSNTTLRMFENQKETGKFRAPYLLDEEGEMLDSFVDKWEIFDTNGNGMHMTCALYRKDPKSFEPQACGC